MSAEITFGQVVKTRRNEIGLTQKELASSVGCATVTLRKIEYDDLRPSVLIVKGLAMALNILMEKRKDFVRLALSHVFRSLSQRPPPRRGSKKSVLKYFEVGAPFEVTRLANASAMAGMV